MKKIIFIAILANLISCYTYINDELPRIRPIKSKINKIEEISFRITGVDDSTKLSDYNKIVSARLEKSNLFNKVNVVSGSLAQADRHHLEIHLKKLNVFGSRYMTTLSVFITAAATTANYFGILIPFYHSDKYSMLVDYYVDGKLSRYDRFNQSSTSVYGPIAGLYNIKDGDSVSKPDDEIIANMADNICFYLNESNSSQNIK